MLRSFKRGVHLTESKLSAGTKIVQAPIPRKVILPLLQHIGAPCEPLVRVGDKVKLYQKIADTKAPCSAPIHASISGKVTDISKHPSPNGTNVLSIVIEQSGEDGSAPKKDTKADRLSPEKLLERIREAGVVGMGGAGFPTHIKLKPKTKVDTVVLNGSECEPFLTADHRLMVEHAEEIIEGLELEMKILKVRRAVVAIEDNKQEAVEAMRRFANRRIEVMPLKTKYPEGAEKILIKAVLGRECAHTRLPSEVGVVVSNVATAKAIHDAVFLRKPLTERVVTVSGDLKEPKNFMVRIGTPVEDLLAFCGAKDFAKLISGGPMMGIAQYTGQVPVSKTCNGVLVISEAVDETPLHCIRCGRCVDACPYYLVPTEIVKAAEHGHYGLADQLHAKECMECGCCSYVCPSKIPLVQHIRVAKAEILKQEKLKREQ